MLRKLQERYINKRKTGYRLRVSRLRELECSNHEKKRKELRQAQMKEMRKVPGATILRPCLEDLENVGTEVNLA